MEVAEGGHGSKPPNLFLAFELYLQKENTGDYDESEVLQWVLIMMNVMNVKLSPYKDFADLLDRGNPDYSLVEQMNEQLEAINKRVELKRVNLWEGR